MGATLLLLLSLTTAGDADAELRKAQELFFQGRYQRVLALLEDVLIAELSDTDRITALELEAYAFYLLDRRDQAAESWQEILGLDPRHEPDPVDVPPKMLAFFRGLPRPEKPPPPTSPAAPTSPTASPPSNQRGCGTWLCLVPFGGGQFANGSIFKGVAFATAEALLLSLNVGLYWTNQREFDEYGRFPDRDLAERRNVMQNTFFGLFVATLIYGIVDAYLFP